MRIIHIGNIANVTYLLFHGLTKEYNIDTILAVKDEPKIILLFIIKTIIHTISTFLFSKLRDYLHLISEELTAGILQFQKRIKVKQLPLELLHSRKIRHFHGSDIRTRSLRKKYF